jgi:phosphate transport system ATP-binding protein
MGNRDIRDDRIDDNELRRKVGLIFQKRNPFPLSIRRNLELPLRETGYAIRTKSMRLSSEL